jgi:hypothetical protein
MVWYGEFNHIKINLKRKIKDCPVSKMLLQNNDSVIQIFKYNNLNISRCQKLY